MVTNWRFTPMRIANKETCNMPIFEGTSLFGSRAFLSKIVQDVRASYWFIPFALTCVALVVAPLILHLDRNVSVLSFQLPNWMRNTQVDGARTLMSVISQSIFGVTGVMYSMTIVAVSFASGNFGPRLVGSFMRDRVNQWSLGILIATFVYSLMITRAIQSGAEADGGRVISTFVPHIAILVALALTLVCILIVIYFVHHIPEMFNISNICADLGYRLVRDIEDLAKSQMAARGDGFEPPKSDPVQILALTESGYIQAIDRDRMVEAAKDNGLQIEMTLPVGEFAVAGTPALRIWGSPADDDTAATLRGCIALGRSPTEHQNVLFILDQLVEVAARALSPGVNDPFTAINCTNWMRAGAYAAATCGDGLTGRFDGPIHNRPIMFAQVLESGFGAARPYTRTDAMCDRHVRAALTRLSQDIPAGAHRDTLIGFIERMDSGDK
jgi:uncharacterized membrane protein